jgi:hypothetical protein
MSNETNSTITPSADPTPAAPASVPATLVAQIRAMRALIPEYQQLPGSERKSLSVVAKSTNPDFVQASINSVGASLILEQVIGYTPDELRQDTLESDNWTVVEDEARALLSGIVAANLVRRHRVGSAALAAYRIASRLVLLKQHANLLPHVQIMKRLNRFGKKRAKTAAPAPPTPAEQVTTSPPEPPKAS